MALVTRLKRNLVGTGIKKGELLIIVGEHEGTTKAFYVKSCESGIYSLIGEGDLEIIC